MVWNCETKTGKIKKKSKIPNCARGPNSQGLGPVCPCPRPGVGANCLVPPVGLIGRFLHVHCVTADRDPFVSPHLLPHVAPILLGAATNPAKPAGFRCHRS
jgi:hypothetical protein